ncbi:MAG: CPBP family intramembrane glutamic endopeptidase [Phycisphaeraceae bacterium]
MTLTARQRLELAALLAIGITPFYLNGLYNETLAKEHRAWFWVVEVFTWIVMPAMLLIVGRLRGLFTFTELGLSRKVCRRDLPWAFLALLVIIPFLAIRLDMVVYQWAHSSLPSGWPHPTFHYSDVVPLPGPDTGLWRLLVLLHLCMTAGVVEEILYRAMFDRLFPRGWAGGIAFVIISTLVFAGAHWEGGLPNVTEAAILGVFYATIYRLTGNLWPLMLGHTIIDWYWFSS